jgi:hypothetical protein
MALVGQLQENYLGSGGQTTTWENSIQIPLASTHFWSTEFLSMSNTWKGIIFPAYNLWGGPDVACM